MPHTATHPLERIRPLQTADLARVADLEQATQMDPWTVAQVLASAPMLETGEYIGTVAEIAGHIQAYVLARVCWDECEILSVGVADECRGQRVGERLLQSLWQQLPAAVRTVHLEVRVSNIAAQRLYARLGFVEVGRRKGYYAVPMSSHNAAAAAAREDALLMSKNLTP